VLQRPFMCLCDRLEYVLSRWWGASSYVLSLFATYRLWGWDGIDRWIYISGVLLVVLLIGNSRRSDRAMHIKLDEIDPRPEHNRLEREDEPRMRGLQPPQRGD